MASACVTCGAENRDGAQFCDSCGAKLAPTESREQRKTVTVLFCDVVGSTSLGESARPRGAARASSPRYFERMRTIVERHGGTVEKFVGDAVMAVFGVPVVHEDDALRAVRAAVEMRDACPSSALQARIGVNTGEVVTGTEERLATGDAVNVAARLQQAAAPGEILIGAATYALARDAVSVEALEPLALKGKARARRGLSAARRRARRARARAAARRADGRPRARARSCSTTRSRARCAGGGCALFTLLGTAGVGKSRLTPSSWRGSTRKSSRDTASPTAKGSRTGPSSRS